MFKTGLATTTCSIGARSKQAIESDGCDGASLDWMLACRRKAPLSNPKHLFHRYLNSYISFFGVGAKQAGFYLGSTLRVCMLLQPRVSLTDMRLCSDDFAEEKCRQGA